MRFYYLVGLLCFSVSTVFAQLSEVGLMVGTSVYSGDLSPQFINVKFLQPAAGIFYRHNFDHHWALKGGLYYGTLTATDSASSDLFQKNRNLQFESSLLEFSAHIEFNFFEYEIGDRKRPFSPYIFTGLSLFDFNPKAEFNGALIELRPLGTEGQHLAAATKKAYSLIQIAIPLGLGIKWNVGQKLSLGFEVGARKTFTDYLDDVSGEYADKGLLESENGKLAADLSDRSLNKSLEKGRQRGNSSDSDWYTFGGVTLSFSIGRTTKVTCTPFDRK